MIATGLTFLLGALLTALVALLVAPLVWRKAQSLARREFEATIPVSANEIRAEFDRVRAEAALSVRRGEILAAEAREKSARSQAELGRSTVENVEILKRGRKLAQRLDEREAELSGLRDSLAANDEEQAVLAGALAAARQDGALRAEELEALGKRFRELTDIAEERKLQVIAAEAKIDRMSDALRVAERTAREAQAAAERVRGETASAERITTNEKSQLAALNDRVATLLAGIADRDEEIVRLKEISAAAATPAAPPAATPDVPQTATAGQRLRATLARKSAPPAGADAEAADIRQQISDIAARVIRMTSLAEGPDSPIARIVATPAAGGQASDATGVPSLAERVRRIVEAERATRPAAETKTA